MIGLSNMLFIIAIFIKQFNMLKGRQLKMLLKKILTNFPTMRLLAKMSRVSRKTHRCKGAESLISSPYFHSISIFNENFVAIQKRKSKIIFNKPIFVGFSVLDISKTVMYDFHYNYIKKTYGNDDAKLL
ncbi:hypothetical protein NQ315_017047 [Exocentrus adspersus]|uniref:Uncharacterized protein n=1 Tax=Exocentrus adspersus TaxID=1586481 RepID=A0AAV8V8E9_9CUCU|nr:hypothetical protein NQ315_017047 [Exocentrus adspersus]